MNRQRIGIVLAALALAATTASRAGTVAFNTSYKGAAGTPTSATCGTTYAITGMEPDDGLTHPVFIYLIGTSEAYNNGHAMAAVQAAADRGFVAASAKYQSNTFGSCTDFARKAACLFKPGSATSAVGALCARPTADCSKGIVVGGFSQGSILATLAKNTDTRVQAAWGMGELASYGVIGVTGCIGNGKRKLPASRLRIVNGEKDQYAGGTAAAVRTSSTGVTGKACASTANTCLNANGSGWILLRNYQVRDKSADHCYQRASGDCSGNPGLVDANWKSGTANWALPASLNWLKTFTTP